MIRLLVIFLFFSYVALAQQHIEGYVYDANTKEPLMGAAVYYEGTTLGTITNTNGKFMLDITERSTSNIVVSFMGFLDQVIPFNKKSTKIFLKPKLENLDEVIIQANPPFTREEMLVAFRQQFLGMTVAGRSCEILNEDTLYFYYDIDRNIFHAEADNKLIIRNKYLGYEVHYTLYKFQVDFMLRSLNPFEARQSYFAGTSFYRDVETRKKKFKRRRARTYRGSTLELMRLVAAEKYEDISYQFYKKRFERKPQDIFKVSDTLGIKKIVFDDKIDIIYDKRERSAIRPLLDYFTVDGYGNHLANSLVFTGIMGGERMGDSLPLDYGLEED